jgi:chromosomal replication initiation ATPase DnaA
MHPSLRRAIIASHSIPKPARVVVIAPVITTLPPSYDPEPTPATAVHVKWYEDHPELEPRITIDKIKRAVSAATGISVRDMVSHRKPDHIVVARQIAMYLARTMMGRSFPVIGRAFNKGDHSSTHHGVRKIEAMIAADPVFAARVKAIQESIHA